MRRILGPIILVLGLAGLVSLAVVLVPGAAGQQPAPLAMRGAPNQHAPNQGTPTPTQTATPPPACGLFWRLVASPNPGSYNISWAVTSFAANDVWAVGLYLLGNIGHALTEHWDGAAWTVVPSPTQGTGNNSLWGVGGRAGNDVWAVGNYANGATMQTLIGHWNGTVWTVVPSPNQGSGNNYLNAVGAVATNDVWAVGRYMNGATVQTLIEHWNGSTWSIVPSPNQGAGDNTLTGLAVVAANDLWAVGIANNQTLSEHWNGSAWSIVPSPNVGGGSNALYSVAAVAANDLWATGSSTGAWLQTLTLHWDGLVWSVVSSPNGPGDSVLHSVAAAAANDIWAVGYGGPGAPAWQPFTEHWNGSIWSIVPIPAGPVAHNATMWGVTAVTGSDVWSVGDDSLTLIQHYSDPCGGATPTRTVGSGTTPTRTPPPSPSQPPPPSSTPTATTSATPPLTPTATATVCPIQFTDVALTNPFYPFIHCLACRGIVGGYPCGGPGEPCPGQYFRPGNNVTRGQTAKIVAESAGFADPVPSTQQTFEDVAPGSTFAVWVERLSTRGLIGGYPCGTPNEPCVAPTNRPYFRPNADVTRGQLAKITSGAAGWTETPTGQTFEDLPGGSPFYLYVERLAARGIIHGYPCGNPGEPCVPPLNRAYFRPNANATRGQMSQIAAAAFFPGCQTPASNTSADNRPLGSAPSA